MALPDEMDHPVLYAATEVPVVRESVRYCSLHEIRNDLMSLPRVFLTRKIADVGLKRLREEFDAFI
ncbi:MAG: hypothetical protein KDA78_18065, partial [Planctomycetaceae bacterium]|nr:hypothetical protein [Planctomycetaceae bacterium]